MKFYNILFGLLILTLNGCGDAVTSSTNDKSSTITLKFEEKEKVFDPKKVYKDSSNPTEI